MIPACCNAANARVAMTEADLAGAARRAARTGLPHHVRAVAEAKEKVEAQKARTADHLANCTVEPVTRKVRGLTPDDHRHGSVQGYRAHCRCDPCRAAAAADRAAARPAGHSRARLRY